jgi:hypothetical protein
MKKEIPRAKERAIKSAWVIFLIIFKIGVLGWRKVRRRAIIGESKAMAKIMTTKRARDSIYCLPSSFLYSNLRGRGVLFKVNLVLKGF